MDKIGKLLKKLSSNEREHLGTVLELLVSRNVASLDIKKLKGVNDVYRVRIGTMRVIFQKKDGVQVLEISRRDENTYEKY